RTAGQDRQGNRRHRHGRTRAPLQSEPSVGAQAHQEGRAQDPADGRADLLLPPQEHQRGGQSAQLDRSFALASRRPHHRSLPVPGRRDHFRLLRGAGADPPAARHRHGHGHRGQGALGRDPHAVAVVQQRRAARLVLPLHLRQRHLQGVLRRPQRRQGQQDRRLQGRRLHGRDRARGPRVHRRDQGEARAQCLAGAAASLHARARQARADRRPAAQVARLTWSVIRSSLPGPRVTDSGGFLRPAAWTCRMGYEESIFSAMTRGRFRYRLPQTNLPRGNLMLRIIGMALAAGTLASSGAWAQDVKVGVVLPLTGGLAPARQQGQAGIKAYMGKKGASGPSKKNDLIIKDDARVPDNSKRPAPELNGNDKVAVVGSGITPSAMAIGPLSTQAKTANVVMVSGTSAAINPNNPYMVRTSFTLGQQSGIIAEWAAKNGSKKVAIVQSDWAPGAEATAVFTDAFTKAGGQVVETIKVPLANPDFAPFLQRARDANPDSLFVFVPASQAGTFSKQFAERGLDKAGIKLIGPGDIVDDNDLRGMGDSMVGVVTAGIYS